MSLLVFSGDGSLVNIIDPSYASFVSKCSSIKKSIALTWTMNQFELNQIRSKLRKLNLDDQFIERYIDKLHRNKEPFVTASKTIDRWEKQDSSQLILQALACGLIASIAGAWFAIVQ